MARLDVYPMPGRSGRGYVVDIQADLLSGLETRVVIPLLPEGVAPMAASGLNPVFEVEGRRHVLMTQAVATVPRRELRGAVASLNGQHDIVLAAIDFLISGF